MTRAISPQHPPVAASINSASAIQAHPARRPRRRSCRRSWLGLLAASVLLFATACGPVYVRGGGGYGAGGGHAGAAVAVTGSNGVDFSYLSSYGVWTNTTRFGQVWVPDANRTPGWRPYYYGRWDYSDYGWTWASDEAWGSGPYHYGRWAWHNQYRWVWIPGNVWGPAWVSWRTGGSYVGWAPLGPGGTVYNHSTYWTFVHQRNIYRRAVNTVIIPHDQLSSVYGHTSRIRHTARIRTHGGRVVTYNAGPRRRAVQRWTRGPVRTRQVTSIRGASPHRRGVRARNHGAAGYGHATTRRPTYRTATRAGGTRTYRPGRAGTTRGSTRTYRPGTRTYRPGRVAPSRPRYSPTYRPSGRAAATTGHGAARRAPSRTYRPAQRTYRPPSRTYRPAPSRAASGRAAPGRVAPGYNRSANPYSTAPRARSSHGSTRRAPSRRAPSRRSSTRRSPSRRSSPGRRAPSRASRGRSSRSH